MLSCYYRNEQPIPADLKEACRLVRATSKAERDAVAQVLREFFELTGDGWRNRRCDKEIAAYQDAGPAREAKKAHERERQRRSRERRAELFAKLREHGEHPPYAAPTSELVTLLSRVTARGQQRDITDPITRDVTAAHSHLPLPTSQSGIDTSSQASHVSASPARTHAREGAGGRERKAEPGGEQAAFERLQAVYPAGIYPKSDWQLVDRAASRLVEDGATSWDEIIAGAERYCAQKRALGKHGTEFVLSPLKFVQQEKFRDEWPLPAKSTAPRRAPSPTTAELEALEAAKETAHAGR